MRNGQLAQFPENADELGTYCNNIREHVSALSGALDSAASSSMPALHGMAPVEGSRLVGRGSQLLDLHARLSANRVCILSGASGNGKTLLAREYSVRFGPAYPGGIFWLNAYGNDSKSGSAEARQAARQDQIRGFARELGVRTDELENNDVEIAFSGELERRGQPCLWIVDDLASDLSREEIGGWTARHMGARTPVRVLITTRSGRYNALGCQLNLGLLTYEEAWRLLTLRRVPVGEVEEAAARQITERLGHHPLAIELAGAYLARETETYDHYCADLAQPFADAVELGAELKDGLPAGHESSVACALLKSVLQLREEGRDFLRIASVLPGVPIAVSLLKSVFAAAKLEGADLRAVRALEQADSLRLCNKAGLDARSVSTLICRAFRFRLGDDSRTTYLRASMAQVLTGRLAVDDMKHYEKLPNEISYARHLVSGAIATKEEASLGLWLANHDRNRAAYGAARRVEERVLEANRRLLGNEHSNTCVAAWNLYRTLVYDQDPQAKRVLEFHLGWLLDRAPETLSEDQQQIQRWVTQAVERSLSTRSNEEPGPAVSPAHPAAAYWRTIKGRFSRLF
jgi:hypothetical protein